VAEEVLVLSKAVSSPVFFDPVNLDKTRLINQTSTHKMPPSSAPITGRQVCSRVNKMRMDKGISTTNEQYRKKTNSPAIFSARYAGCFSIKAACKKTER